ncbi:MAG: hypothetical protein LBG62_04505 [Candidatus Methanoplasma sp.]|jgi:hypothetical protein|nr:hypothetical protein [Candidatus Methanoplasma sp.]
MALGYRGGTEGGEVLFGVPETEIPSEEARQDRFESGIVRAFPPFLAACVALVAALTVYLGNYTFAGALYCTCAGFALGFAALGLVCVFMSSPGVIPRRHVLPIVIALPAATAVALNRFGTGQNEFVVRFFDMFGYSTSFSSLLISTYSITLLMFLVAYGVTSVIVGYFRKYFYRALLSLESPSEARGARIAKWLFKVPDVLDVDEVVLDPEGDDGFDFKLFAETASSLFILGVAVCTYIFLNPVFLRAVPFGEMLFIGVVLSLFMSPLVLPWSIVRSLGAKALSSAPRPFYLWKGMRERIYQGFFAVSVFMMLLTISAYMGSDLLRITTTYVGYMAFMAMISVTTSFVYVNVFYRGFKRGIVRSFDRARESMGRGGA